MRRPRVESTRQRVARGWAARVRPSRRARRRRVRSLPGGIPSTERPSQLEPLELHAKNACTHGSPESRDHASAGGARTGRPGTPPISRVRTARSNPSGRRTANLSSYSSTLASSSVDGSYAKTGRIICGEQDSGESKALSAQSIRRASRSNTLRARAARRIGREGHAPLGRKFKPDARCAETGESQRGATERTPSRRTRTRRSARARQQRTSGWPTVRRMENMTGRGGATPLWGPGQGLTSCLSSQTVRNHTQVNFVL